MSLASRLPGVTIGELPPYTVPLDGGESVEITSSTRQDGGGSVTTKTFRLNISTLLDLYAARKNNPNTVTAEQVGAYTIPQVDTLLQGKLGRTEQAADSLRLAGSTATQIIDQARAGLLLVVQYDSDLDQLAAAFDDASTVINTP